jgi:hypothetical protein
MRLLSFSAESVRGSRKLFLRIVRGLRSGVTVGRGLGDGQPREVAELDQLGRLGIGVGQPDEGGVDIQHLVETFGSGGELVEVQVGPLRGCPIAALFLLCLRRALSTRMRRMASAAAAKKWPRLFQCCAVSTSTSRR